MLNSAFYTGESASWAHRDESVGRKADHTPPLPLITETCNLWDPDDDIRPVNCGVGSTFLDAYAQLHNSSVSILTLPRVENCALCGIGLC